jgi:bacteriophage N4 adsorption protein B
VPARTAFGGFLPSNGVGTGYTRRALEALAASASNRVFNPACLTEDYDCGIRLHALGFRQLFIPIQFAGGEPVATREYFPQRFRQAVRQRTRWVIGIALQGWELHGWRGGPGTIYWFWRDRKGLLGNPLSLGGNLVCLYGLVTWTACQLCGCIWELGRTTPAPAEKLWLIGALASQVFRLVVRARSTASIYGWRHAAAVPVRAIAANWMNAIATVLAIQRYLRARLARRSHVWWKTEHTYPSFQHSAFSDQLSAVSLQQPTRVADSWLLMADSLGSVAGVDADVVFGEVAGPEASLAPAAAVDHKANHAVA